jgi:hypothetical protein
VLLLVRCRSHLARHPGHFWAVVVALAGVVTLVVLSQLSAARRAESAWSDRVGVWVAVGDTDAGDLVAVRAVELPAAAAPTRAVVDDPSGSIARRPIVAGAVLTDLDLADGRDDLIPTGHGAIAVAFDDTTLPVIVGDVVDVVADGAVVAAHGVVIERTDSAVVVAVDIGDAPAAALAALERRASLVLRER